MIKNYKIISQNDFLLLHWPLHWISMYVISLLCRLLVITKQIYCSVNLSQILHIYSIISPIAIEQQGTDYEITDVCLCL